MSNYPPGVTGNEWQIAGPQREWDDERACDNSPVRFKSISDWGHSRIIEAMQKLEAGKQNVALGILRTVNSTIETIDLDECPFVGSVTLQLTNGVVSWECPLCGAEHEEEGYE